MSGLDQMSKRVQAVPRHCKGYGAQGVSLYVFLFSLPVNESAT
jgi:hypothetical protein